VAAQHGLQRLRVAAAGDALDPPAKPSRLPDQPDDRDRQSDDDDDETDDDEADVGRDERVDVDRTSSCTGQAESSVRRSPGAHCYPSAAMAKKTRYPTKSSGKPAAKPAARIEPKPNTLAPIAARPTPASAPRPVDAEPMEFGGDEMPLRSSSALTDAEMQRAEQLEADMVAKERAAIAESLRRKARAQAGEGHHDAGDVNAPLKVRMAHEYAYVSRDVKRIALTGGLMIAILALLEILINVMGVIKI
jgi:hypothetical protein